MSGDKLQIALPMPKALSIGGITHEDFASLATDFREKLQLCALDADPSIAVSVKDIILPSEVLAQKDKTKEAIIQGFEDTLVKPIPGLLEFHVRNIVFSQTSANPDSDYIQEVVEKLTPSIPGIVEGKKFLMELALEEALVNHVCHGNRCDPRRVVGVEFGLNNRFNFEIRTFDQGVGFDASKLPDPTLDENLENPGGRGVFLIKSIMDEAIFDRQQLTMVLDLGKHLQPAVQEIIGV